MSARPVLGPPAPWQPPDVHEARLANGLTVRFCPTPGREMAAAELVLDIPVDCDPPDVEGVVYVTASSVDEGTEQRDALGFADALQSVGGQWHADAGWDGVWLGVDGPLRRLPDVLALMAEAVTRPAFPEVEVDRVIRQRLDGIRREMAVPAARGHLAFLAAFHPAGTRGARPEGGDADSVARVDRDAVAAMWAQRADPATSTLILAGDAEPAAAIDLLEVAFSHWTSAGATATTRATQPVQSAGRVVLVDRPGAVQTYLVVGHSAPDRRHPDFAALSLANHALGGGLTSRIDAVLREEKGYTYGIRSALHPRRRGGVWQIAGSVDTASTGAAVGELVALVNTTIRDGVTEAERQTASDYLVGITPLRWETPRAVAEHLANEVGNDLPDGWTGQFLRDLRDATAEQVNAALRAHLVPDEMLTVAVGDAAAIAGPLADSGIGSVEVVEC